MNTRKKTEAVPESHIDCWKNTQGYTLTKWNSIDKRRESFDKNKHIVKVLIVVLNQIIYWICSSKSI